MDCGRRAPPPADDAPLVSILVPARNEARNIEAVRALAAGAGLPELRVDRARRSLGRRHRRASCAALGLSDDGSRRVLPGEPLPGGLDGQRLGLPPALARGRGGVSFFHRCRHRPRAGHGLGGGGLRARRSRGSALRVAAAGDGDVGREAHHPDDPAARHGALSALARALSATHPHLAARLPASRARTLGAANGQFMFFTRAGLRPIGGHAALRDHLVEDVALGRAVAARMGEGMRLLNCESLRLFDLPDVSLIRGGVGGFHEEYARGLRGFAGRISRHRRDADRAAFCCRLSSLFPRSGAPAHRRAGRVIYPHPRHAHGALPHLVAELRSCIRSATRWRSAIGLNSWRRLATQGVTGKAASISGRHRLACGSLAFRRISRNVPSGSCASAANRARISMSLQRPNFILETKFLTRSRRVLPRLRLPRHRLLQLPPAER